MREGYILDYCTGKQVDARKPEERVRQEYEETLCLNYNYEKEQIDIEVPIQMGVSTKKADIVIYKTSEINKRDPNNDIFAIIETKSHHRRDGISQLKSYMSATSCEYGVWTNGDEIEYIYRDLATRSLKEKHIFQIPKRGQKLEDLNNITKNKLQPAKNLKLIFKRIHKTLYSNTNISRKHKFGNELMRLIFCKIHDELYNIDEKPKFRLEIGEDPRIVKERIVELWEDLKGDLIADGIFEEHETIVIDDNSIVYIVGELENYSLTRTDKDVVGAAFEIFAERQFAGEKGEFFTPRPIVKMCIDILDPGPNETIIDPACGSGGFLIYALEHVWQRMDKSSKYKNSPDLKDSKKKIAQKCFYGIDKEVDLVKICKAYMQIVGDGKSNVVCTDSLKMPDEWSNEKAKATMLKEGKLKKFDYVITNPPFGSKIKIKHKHILRQYDLGYKYNKEGSKTNTEKETDPQILFIELCMKLLKDGGKMAIVLPDGIFGNPSDNYIREFIKEKCKILAIVDCTHTSFMPHTHTKTSVLIVEKWNGEKTNNYPVLMSVVEKCGHDNRGKDLYKKDENGHDALDEEFSIFSSIYKNNTTRVIADGFNKLGFTVYEGNLKKNILVPRYYNPETKDRLKNYDTNKYELKSIKELVDANLISIKSAGVTANSNEYTIYDNIPFLRTSDLGVFETRNKAVQNVNEETYIRYKDKQNLQEGDILFVKDGTYRIGETIILTKYDLKMLVQSHFLIIKSLDKEVLSPYLLFYLINTDIARKQIEEKTFVQSPLSTIGDRLHEVILPIPNKENEKREILKEIEASILKRRELRGKIARMLSN